jgi:predicted small lipoprotein YifL
MVVRFAVLMATVAVLAGCGQKGPLYLPDKGGEVVTRPGGGAAQQQAPQSQPPGTQAAPASPPADQSDAQKKKDQPTQQNPRN